MGQQNCDSPTSCLFWTVVTCRPCDCKLNTFKKKCCLLIHTCEKDIAILDKSTEIPEKIYDIRAVVFTETRKHWHFNRTFLTGEPKRCLPCRNSNIYHMCTFISESRGPLSNLPSLSTLILYLVACFNNSHIPYFVSYISVLKKKACVKEAFSTKSIQSTGHLNWTASF